MDNLSKGKKGEELAANYLKQIGYKLIAKNFRIRGGELDLIMKDNKTFVFVEVKTRTNLKFGLGEESIGYNKIKTLKKTIEFYKKSRDLSNISERLDVISVDLSEKKININHIKNITL